MNKASAPKRATKAKLTKVQKKAPVAKVAKRSITKKSKPTTFSQSSTTLSFTPLKLSPLSFTPTKSLTFGPKRFFSTDQNPANYQQDPKAVESRVFDVLGRFDKIDKSKLQSQAHFQNDLGLDSLDRVEVVLAIEEEFNVEFSDEQSDKFMGVADIVDYIARKPDIHQRNYKPDDI